MSFMRLDSDIETGDPVGVCGPHGYQSPSLVSAFSAVVPSSDFPLMVQDIIEVLVLPCHPRSPSNSVF